MQQQEWLKLLVEINQEMMSDEKFVAGNLVTDEQRQTGWLGQPGASEAELAQLEQRLGCQLPPSYRSFLAASNGFGPISYFIYNLYSTDEVEWLAAKEPELVEMWEDEGADLANNLDLADDPYLRYDGHKFEGALRPTHMQQCLMISDWGDAGFFALNPALQHEGEWEAWHFANWHPGAVRYRSFAELMRASLESTQYIRQGLA